MKTKMNPNSLEAYEGILPKLNEKESEVLNAVLSLDKCATNKEIAKRLGWEINRVTGRTNALVKKGVLEPFGKVKKNGTTQTLWSFVEHQKQAA